MKCKTTIYLVQTVLALGAHADALLPPGQAPRCVAQDDLGGGKGDKLPILPVIEQKPSPHHHTQPKCILLKEK